MSKEPLDELTAVASKEDVLQLQKQARQVYVHPVLIDYMAELVQESRKHHQVEHGISPRGTLALLNSARAYALVKGREYVVPEDIKTVAVPVLAHRIQTNTSFQKDAATDVIQGLLSTVSLPTEDWKSR